MDKNPTWAEARAMLHALRSLARMNTPGASLTFQGGYVGTVADGSIELRHPQASHEEAGELIFRQPLAWPISQAAAE
jgi:hypothetical protein